MHITLHSIIITILLVFAKEDQLERLFREDTLTIISRAEELLSLIF